MHKYIFYIVCLLSLKSTEGYTTYDQSQTGDLNVQVDLKDVHIIALMKGKEKEEYVDYDYAYDYSEMTIKPQNGTTPKPLNVSSTPIDVVKDNGTIETTVPIEQTTASIKNSTWSNIETTSANWTPNNDTKTTKFEETPTEITEATGIKNTTVSPVSNNNPCRKGFIINAKGRCELKLQGTSNALLKIVKLSQKLKLRRENRRKNQEEPQHV